MSTHYIMLLERIIIKNRLQGSNIFEWTFGSGSFCWAGPQPYGLCCPGQRWSFVSMLSQMEKGKFLPHPGLLAGGISQEHGVAWGWLQLTLLARCHALEDRVHWQVCPFCPSPPGTACTSSCGEGLVCRTGKKEVVKHIYCLLLRNSL